MKEVVHDLAGGRGRFVRSIHKLNLGLVKLEFGKIVAEPGSKIGKHGHYDDKKWKHCEIYVVLFKHIFVNGWRRVISICRNAEHEAENISENKAGTIFFLKLWWR